VKVASGGGIIPPVHNGQRRRLASGRRIVRGARVVTSVH
jgi:hypothetical protein